MTLRDSAIAAREAGEDGDFESVKAAARLLDRQLKTNATVVAQTLPSVASASRPSRPSAAGPDLAGIEAAIGLLTHSVRRLTEVVAQAVRMPFSCEKQG